MTLISKNIRGVAMVVQMDVMCLLRTRESAISYDKRALPAAARDGNCARLMGTQYPQTDSSFKLVSSCHHDG